MEWQEGLKKVKIILKEKEPAKRPPRRVYIRGTTVIARVPRKQETIQ